MGSGIVVPRLSPMEPARPSVAYQPQGGDMGDMVAKAMQLKSMAQGQQLQQQQIQGAQQENQIRQIQVNDQQAMTKAMQEWDGKDYNALPGIVVKHGASANAVMGLKNSIIEQQTRLTQLSKDQLANEKVKNDYLAQLLDNVKSLPPDQQPQAFEQAKADAVSKQYLDPQHAQQMAYPGPEGLALIEKSLLGYGGTVESALKAQETATSKASQGRAEAETAKVKSETNPEAPINPEFQKSKYQNILGRMQSGQPVTRAEKMWFDSYVAAEQKTSTSSDSLGVTSSTTSGPAGFRGGARSGGGGGSSASTVKSSIVDEIGEYKMDAGRMGFTLRRHPELIDALRTKYPDWDQTEYAAKAHMMQGYTSGTQSREINAINTAMGHVKAMDDAVDALNNGDATALNKIGNAFGINVTGQTPAAAFRLIVHRVGPEIASAYIPGAGGEAERIATASDFSENLPAQTLHNNAAITAKLLRSKIAALENQYKNTVKRDDFNERFITPEARAALQKFGGGGQGGGKEVHYKIVNGQLVTQ
jgi:hypothetical protein